MASHPNGTGWKVAIALLSVLVVVLSGGVSMMVSDVRRLHAGQGAIVERLAIVETDLKHVASLLEARSVAIWSLTSND